MFFRRRSDGRVIVLNQMPPKKNSQTRTSLFGCLHYWTCVSPIKNYQNNTSKTKRPRFCFSPQKKSTFLQKRCICRGSWRTGIWPRYCWIRGDLRSFGRRWNSDVSSPIPSMELAHLPTCSLILFSGLDPWPLDPPIPRSFWKAFDFFKSF